MSSFLDASQQQDDEGEWEEMPVVRSAVSQMPKSAFQDMDEDEQRRYKYRPPSPTGSRAGAGAYVVTSGSGGAGASASSPTALGSASGMAMGGKRNSRTGNATGRQLDIDDARGYNWRSKPAGMGGGQDDDHADSDGRRRRRGTDGSYGDDEEDDDDDDGGGAKGYTQLRIDEDEEAEQLHAATEYLFGADMVPGQDVPSATPLSQLATTKQLLTEQQKIAYVGLCSLATRDMVRQLERIPGKEPGVVAARTSATEWRVRVMARLYQHMDIETSEQTMIDSLAQHGVLIEDLAPSLITTHTVSNPDYDPEAAAQEAKNKTASSSQSSPRPTEAKLPAEPAAQTPTKAESDEPPIAPASDVTDARKVEAGASEAPTTPASDQPIEPVAAPRDQFDVSEGDIVEGDIGEGDLGDGDIGDGDIGDGDIGDGDMGIPSTSSSAGPSRLPERRPPITAAASSSSASSAEPSRHSAIDLSGDLSSSDALDTSRSPKLPGADNDDDITAASAADFDERASTPKPPRLEEDETKGTPSTHPQLERHTEPPEEDGKRRSKVLVDPNTASQLEAQLDTTRPPIGPTLGLTAEPIPIEPPPAALEGVTTSLSTADKDITLDIRWTVLCDLFLVLTADSVYDARSRVLLERVAAALSLSWMDVTQFEKRVTDALEIEEGVDKLRNKRVIAEREKLARNKRYVMMGLATVGGGLVIGLSAGLLAPVIGAGLGAALGAVGIGGTGTFLGGVGGAAIITTTGTLGGAGIAGKGMSRRTRSVKTFEFKAVHNNKRVNCIVGMPGFMSGTQDDVRLPFSVLDSIMGDVFSVLWEPDMMQEMGNSLGILWNETLTQGVQQILALTVAGGLVGALTWPMWLMKLGYLIDNPWSNALDRAKAAGLILADVLAKRQLGVRPITLVGFSLGARAIFYALVELARIKAFGVVQNVYIMGTPVTASDSIWKEARSVVAGRFVNVFSRSDWILGYLYRATSGGLRSIAGLHPVERIPDIENVDVTHVIPGHLAYRALMPLVLNELQFRTTADYFDEPVDVSKIPIRQVVNEEQVEEEKKGAFARLFRRNNSKGEADGAAKGDKPLPSPAATPTTSDKKLPPGRPPIEEYDEYDDDELPARIEHSNEHATSSSAASAPAASAPSLPSTPVINSPPARDSPDTAGTPTRLGPPSPHFDADAILAELRQSGIQVRELQSSLPPLVAQAESKATKKEDLLPLPSRSAGLQVHAPPSPVHDRSRANSFASATTSPGPLPSAPAVLGGGGGAGANLSTSNFGASTPDFHTGGTAPPSSALKSTSSMTFNQQEDFGTARDRGLSRQLPSLSTASVSDVGYGGGGDALGGPPASAPPPPTKKPSMSGFGFPSLDMGGWGSSPTPSPGAPASAQASLSSFTSAQGATPGQGPSLSMMSLDALPPPQAPSLTFGGEDGELSFAHDSPRLRQTSPAPPGSAPWASDNPWS